VGGFFAGLREKILQTAVNAGLMLALKDRINHSSEKLLRSLAAAKRSRGGGDGLAARAASVVVLR